MEFRGEWLSPQNSISLDEDKLTKYFYFRPDKYENRLADVENIFIIRNHENFPKRYDLLAENSDYAVDSIEVTKKVDDDSVAVNNVSFIVTATYDLLANIRARESGSEPSSGGGGGSELDEDDNPVTSETPPWKRRAVWSWTPITVTKAFNKAYSLVTDDFTLDTTNSAGDRIIADTTRYRFEINYSKSYSTIQTAFDLMEPFVNDLTYSFPGPYSARIFSPGKLLILPPSNTVEYYDEADGDIIEFFTYTIKIIYDPKGWEKEFLDVGLRAKFGSATTTPEDIYHLIVYESENSTTPSVDSFTSLAEVMKAKVNADSTGKIVSAERISEPMPLNNGFVYLNAITDPVSNPYKTVNYEEFRPVDFSTLPFRK